MHPASTQPLIPAHSPLRRALGYKKFRGHRHTVLLLDSHYHLHAECRRALLGLGHRVITLKIGGRDGARQASDAMQQLLGALLTHKPDMLLSINHIGFDAHNSMGQLLDALQIPTAIWYVDSPFLLFDGFFLPAPEVSEIFVWDRTYVALMRHHGVEAVSYLPLGCDPQTFNAGRNESPCRPSVFVGSSMAYAEQKWRARLRAAERRAAKQLIDALLLQRSAFVEAAQQASPPPDRRMTALAYATWTATGHYRNRLLRSLLPMPLEIFGDADWAQVLPEAKRHPYVPYGPGLAKVYGQSVCCINATSLQMPSAVNQRVFDVPMAGSLVISDAQADASALFADDEICTYTGAAELQDKVRFFGSHPTARRQLIERAQRRILAEHTYAHRLGSLMQTMQQRWA